MKRNRRLDSLVKQALNASVKNGKIAEEKVSLFSKTFAKLHRPEAIYALSKYLKLLKMEKEKSTMTVFSLLPLSDDELKEIKKAFNLKFEIKNLKLETNTSLLGGIMVKIGDMVFDYSVKNKIIQVGEAIKS